MMDILSLVLLLGTAAASPVSSRYGTGKCGSDFLAKYNISVETLWSRDLFYKQYPLFRPHAQWSQLVGRSHNDVYNLWQLGDQCRAAVRLFAERADTSLLDQESQGTRGILDSFTAPPIDAGVGTSSSLFLVDENHSKLSAIMRIVPSPDWFVGLDSLELCENSEWLTERVIEIGPMDAGTDQGFTFTAPNWPETPALPVSAITAKHPSHPANSFFYPEWEELPTLARVTFTRVDLGDTSDVPQSGDSKVVDGDGPEDEVSHSAVGEEQHSGRREHDPIDGLGAEGPRLGTMPAPTDRPRASQLTTTVARIRPFSSRVAPTASSPHQIQREEKKKRRRRPRKNRRNKDKKHGRVNCEVGEWSEWGACSKTCGYGKKLRIRTPTVEPRKGGLPCPPLMEEQICGSMRSCGWDHFSFSSWNTDGGDA